MGGILIELSAHIYIHLLTSIRSSRSHRQQRKSIHYFLVDFMYGHNNPYALSDDFS